LLRTYSSVLLFVACILVFLISLYVPSFLFFFSCYAAHRDLHSFPTRRSSDLARSRRPRAGRCPTATSKAPAPSAVTRAPADGARSEEHTSELQSRGHLVCRLLLEKKKKTNTIPESTDCNTVNGIPSLCSRLQI